MIGAAAAYLSGLFFASFFFENAEAMLILMAILLAVAIIGKIKGLKSVDFIIIIVFFFSAVTVNRLYTSQHYNRIISYSGYDVSFSGSVTDYDAYEKYASYILNGKINGEQRAKVKIFTDNLNADYGDRITIENCVFSEPNSDYLFDSKTYNKARHIYLEASFPKGVTITEGKTGKVRSVIGQFRESMTNALIVSGGIETGGFLSGMIFGEKLYIDSNSKTSLYRSGIGHILAISGLHVSIIAAVFLRLVSRFKLNKYVQFMAVNVLILFLIILTNYTVSAIRAALMFDVAYSARLFGEQNDSFNSLSAAVLIICLTDCYAVYNSGFILSISGTFGLAVFSPFMTKDMKNDTAFDKVKIAFAVSLCTSLAIMPASMYYFDETSLIAPVANVLLIPFCVAAMMFGLVFVITGGMFGFILFPAKLLMSIVLTVSEIAAEIKFFHISRMSSIMPVLFLISGAVIAAVCIFTKDRRFITAIISVVVAMNTVASSVVYFNKSGRMSVAVLGNEGNMAVVISSGGRSIITDISGDTSAERYVGKYLSQNGFDNVDALILSGNSQNKYAVYKDRLRYFSPKEVYTYMCSVEDSVQYYGITMEGTDYTMNISDGQLSITSNGTKILFEDIEGERNNSRELMIYHDESNRFLQGMNNFEIIFDNDGKYEINRL